MAKATSISAANLSRFVQSAVKASTQDVPGRLVSRGPTMGYVLAQSLTASKALNLATTIATGVASSARAAGVAGIRPKPVVITRPGTITVGFIAEELGISIR